MALSSTTITATDVATVLGTTNRTWSHLCAHPNINKWSKWKPVRSNSEEALTEQGMINFNCGLVRPDMWDCNYLTPRGGAYNEFYRLLDFRNYNHAAIPPVNIEIVQVTEMSTGNVLSAPYRIFFDFHYKIEFKLPIAGEIDPLWINSQTSRTKNTDAGGGYGGLTWVSGVNNAVARASSDVFTCPSGATVLSQIILLAENGTMPPLRMQYCEYNGSGAGNYTTVPYTVEDNSYMDSFITGYVALTLSLNSRWDGIAGKVNSTLTTVNDSGRAFSELRARFVYTINGGSAITTTIAITTLSTGTNYTNAFLNAGNPGSNTYAVTCYLERFDNISSSWQQIGVVSRTQTITIPTA